MKCLRLLVLLCSILILSTCVSSNRPPSVVDIPSFRTYITGLRADVVLADESSFEEGEQAQITTLSGQILQALGEADSFGDFDDEQKDNLIVLNEQLHVLIVGEDEVRASGRICRVSKPIGSNIRQRTCRTRDRMTQDREAARLLLQRRDEYLNRNSN